MNHSQLRAFHAVASEGSFTKAAEALHVTQPTLSGQVKALEETYGVRLFDRRGRRVAPTALGQELLVLTRRLFSLEAETEHLLSAAQGLRKGHLRVGADAPYHVTAALSAFTQRYPGIQISLTVGNSAELAHDLLEHKLDVAVLANVSGDPRFYRQAAAPRPAGRLRRQKPSLGEAPAHRPRRSQGTAPGPARTGLRHPADLRDRHGPARALPRGEVLDMNSREAVRETVAAGLGVGVVSAGEFSKDSRLAILELTGADMAMTEYIVCLAERQDLRLVRSFLDLVR